MPNQSTKLVCKFPDCGRPVELKKYGLCAGHRSHMRSGKPLKVLRPRRTNGDPPVIRCEETPCPVMILQGPCQVFIGAKMGGGYGIVSFKGRSTAVHRYVWERDVGVIPIGMELDHVCMVRACCNVLHMRIVTDKENSTENSRSVGAVNKSKTHCLRGHFLAGDNLMKTKRGYRKCLECNRESQKRYRLRRLVENKRGT